VTAQDEFSDRDADLIRAAEAAASWVRARRATWTTVQSGSVASAAPAPEPEPQAAPEPIAPVLVPEPPVRSLPASKPARSYASVAAQVATSVRSAPPNVVRGVALAALVAALGTVVFMGASYVWRSAPAATTAKPAVVEPAAGRAPAGARKTTGTLRVNSTPAGARVTVDGKARGVTPLTLSDLPLGRHEVTLESNAGTVHRTVSVAANEAAQVDESIFSGWLAVFAPFEVVIAETNRVLRPDERGQILLSPGLHQLRVANRTLGYEASWNVEIKPGETTSLRVTPDPSTLTVTSPEAAEVWIDGTKVGDTPLNAAPVQLGTHDVLVKRANGAERRYTITVTAKPFTLNADFR